ncbi:hypothetical protein [Fictibacillus fluitans]|uniref:Methyltransferase type 11 domain-containing protein n=1 Tax=Fictibacillus fluitans TaxID=3058422 RepID=A0ABT8HS87_9BACL|nr:hypothetical protein [Fictibacillus sp. NE201]MDN4523626.1 hypothetical protein [Fictibacillus sp. NE201]
MGLFQHKFRPQFNMNGKQFYYSKSSYNNFSERSIEVPVAKDFFNKYKEKKILEVGNVFKNYNNEKVTWDVIDKFEVSPNVLNIDLMDYEPVNKYDAIVSVSTIEHIGQTTEPTGTYGENTLDKDREAPLKAIIKIYNLLKLEGEAFITVPYGKLVDFKWLIQFNKEYLYLLFAKFGLPKEDVNFIFYKKTDMELMGNPPVQLWEQVNMEQLSDTKFDSPFPCANGIVFIFIKRTKSKDIILNINQPETNLFYNDPDIIPNFYFSKFTHLHSFDSSGWIQIPKQGLISMYPEIQLDNGEYEITIEIEVKGNKRVYFDLSVNNKSFLNYEFAAEKKVKTKFNLSESKNIVSINLYSGTDQEIRGEFRVKQISLAKIIN